MMRAIILLLVLLSACASPSRTPIVKTFDARTVEVTWVRKTAACAPRDLACAEFGVSGGKHWCHIRAPEPQSMEDEGAMILLGHELMHCFYGEVHSDWHQSVQGALMRQSDVLFVNPAIPPIQGYR